jgi:hypothetical protein
MAKEGQSMPALPRLLLGAAAVLLPLIALSADATPVQYDYVFGNVSVTLVEVPGGAVVGADTATLTGTFATFDEAVPELVDFEWIVDDDSVVLGALGSIDAYLTATAAPLFSAPATDLGGGVYSWTGGAMDVAGSLSFTGGLLDGQTIPVAVSFASINGMFRTSTVATETFGITNAFDIYQFSINDQEYRIRFNIGFKGVPQVPEPSAVALVALGLAAIARRLRRSR